MKVLFIGGTGIISRYYDTPDSPSKITVCPCTFVHYNRDDDNFARDKTALAWSSPDSFASGDVNGVALIQSSFTTGSKHHLEAVYVAGDKLFGAWRNDGGGYAWNITSAPIASGIRGTPGFIQSQQGTVGNFELVVPLASGGIAHYFRDNDSGQGWVRSAVFGSGFYDAAVMIQSSIGVSGSDGGNLEVLARKGTDLYHFFRGQSGAALTWSAGKKIASGVTGSPGFIQSSTGTVGNFEMITPLLAGGMAHFYRDNDSATPNWVGPQQILDMTSGAVSAVSIIESRYPGGPIEYVARKDGELYWGNRDPSSLEWQGPYSFSSQPCCDPRAMGKWGDAVTGNVVGIHAALLKTGKVLFYGFKWDTGLDHADIGNSELFDAFASGGPSFTATSWDTGSSSLPHPTLFCAGQSQLPDGRLLVSGGDGTDRRSFHIFDPATSAWGARHRLDEPNGVNPEPTGDDPFNRWYPTTATLANGAVFMISGSQTGPLHDWDAHTEASANVNNSWQIYTPGSSPTLTPRQFLPASPWMFSPPQGPNDENSPSFQPIDLYPWVYLLPNGNLFVHSRTTSRILTNPTQANPAWSASFYQTISRVPRTYPRQGSAVLLPLRPPDYKPQILITGGAGAKWPDLTGAATNTVEKLDLSAAAPAWATVAPMNYPRVLQDAVLLPDGKVFVVGGSARGRADDGIAPVLTPELYDPAANTWTKLCPMRVPRGYHSTALLLPDGRVMVAGKDGSYQTEPYHYPEIGNTAPVR